MSFQKFFSVDNVKKTGFHEHDYDFSVDYDNIAVDDILDIHKYFMKNQWSDSINEMCGIIKKFFIAAVTFVGSDALISSNLLKCVSMSNQECRIRPTMVNINSNEPLFYLDSLLVTKYSCRYNDINDPHANSFVSNVFKTWKLKYLIYCQEQMKRVICLDMRLVRTCKYRLDASVWNDKRPWNNDKCRCECKELIDKGKCDDGFI